MTDAPAQISLPSKAQLVAEAIARLDTAGVKSQLLRDLDKATLADLCLRLVDPKLDTTEVIAWLNKELGGSGDDDSVVNKNAVYRFNANFRRQYGQVRTEHCRRVARLTVDHTTRGDIAAKAVIATNRLTDLITEQLLDADVLDDLSGKDLAATIATLDGIAKQQFKKQELELKVADSDRKAAKLEADLRLAQLKLDQAKQKFDAEIKARQDKRADRQLTQEDIDEARRAIFGEAA